MDFSEGLVNAMWMQILKEYNYLQIKKVAAEADLKLNAFCYQNKLQVNFRS